LGNGDRTVRDRVIELGLHSNWRGEEQAAKKEQRLSFKNGHQNAQKKPHMETTGTPKQSQISGILNVNHNGGLTFGMPH
jgi:hypothetical protein